MKLIDKRQMNKIDFACQHDGATLISRFATKNVDWRGIVKERAPFYGRVLKLVKKRAPPFLIRGPPSKNLKSPLVCNSM